MANKKFNRVIILAVTLLALTALFALTVSAEGISGGMGKLLGLDANKSYLAASVTISPDGTGAAVGDYDAVDADSTGLAGLYYVKESTEEGKGTLVYVYGSATDRKTLGNIAHNDKYSRDYVLNDKWNGSWVPGTFLTYDQAEGYWTNAGSYSLTDAANIQDGNYIGYEFYYEYWALTHTREETLTHFASCANKDTYMSGDASNAAVKYFDLIYKNETYYNQETGEITEAGIARRDELLEFFETEIEKIRVIYAYDSTEIIPVNELLNFRFIPNVTQTSLSGASTPEVDFFVMDKNGSVTPYTWRASEASELRIWYTAITGDTDSKVYNVSVQDIAGLPDEGYIVGFEINPYTNVQLSSDSWRLTTTASNVHGLFPAGAYNCYIYFDGYTIALPKAAAPENLEVDGMVVEGFDDELEYVAYNYNNVLLGTIGEEIEVSGASFTASSAGLWGFKVVGSEEYTESDITIVYVPASSRERQEIGTMMETPPSGYSKFASALSDTATEDWYLGYFFLPGGKLGNGGYQGKNERYGWLHAGFLSGTAQNALKDAADDVAKTAARAAIVEELSDNSIRYGYLPEEIIPTDELLTFTFGVRGHTTYFSNFYIYPRVVFYVVDSKGEIHECEWTSTESKNFTGYYTSGANECKFVVDVSSLNLLDGYVVGFEIFPFDKADTNNMTVSNSGQINMYYNFYYGTKDYEVKADPAEINASLLLDGKIGLKIEADFKDASITEATYEGFTPDSFTVKDGIATAIVYVAPKDVTKTALTGSITAGDVTLNFNDVSVATCVEYYQGSTNELVKSLAGALEVYYTYAENYFSNADALPEVELSDDETLALSAEITAQRPDDNALEAVGLKLKSSSLILEGATTIRHYFTIIDADAYTSSGLALDKYSDDICYIEAENIAAHQLSTAAEAVVADGLVIKFSAIDYAKLTFEGNSKLANLVRALYKYSVAADAYWAVYGNN